MIFLEAAYEFSNGTDNTHTWVDVGVGVVSVGAIAVLGTVAAPAVLVGGVLYAGFTLAGGEQWIDDNFGYR